MTIPAFSLSRRVPGAAAALVVSALLLGGCARPEAPTLEPKKIDVKKVALDGLTIDLTLDAYNPNSIALDARSVKAHAKLGGKIDLGEVEVKTGVDIPAKKHATLTVPMTLQWNDVGAVALLAATKPTVDFTVDGTARVGGKDVHFDVPFHTGGTLTREQLLALGQNALPPQIPKLPF